MAPAASEDAVLFRAASLLKIGDICRYTIEYEPDPANPRKSLWVYVFNKEITLLGAAYLQGPYTLCVDCRPEHYREKVSVAPDQDEPTYNNNVRAGQKFKVELHIRGSHKHCWIIDVSSEVMFSSTAKVHHSFVLGTSRHACKSQAGISVDQQSVGFKVNLQDTLTLWCNPLPQKDKPLHLVVLTHGLMSNVTADLLYIKEQIDAMAEATGQNIVCRGYTGNAGKTETGTRKQGRKLANWLVDELIPAYKPTKMSFFAHSLGGIVQTYALGYIEATHPDYFKKQNIELVNFITMASPFLGITSENPGYVRLALDFGVAGKSGRDLGLSWSPGEKKPLLRQMPSSPAHGIIQQFENRTIYANAVNDGIVPLRTASLLYLDWRAISRAAAAKSGQNAAHYSEQLNDPHKVERQNTEKGPLDHKGRTKQAMPTHNPFTNPFTQKRSKAIVHSQTNTDQIHEHYDRSKVRLPRKSTLLESGYFAFMPPRPDAEFIKNPSAREDVIFHDRVYEEKDLPPRRFKRKPFKRDDYVEQARNEEKMARAWHRGMSWRKVIVQLLPDAHNNIIVRRRFANAYGWPVVHHMVDAHFRGDNDPKESDLTRDMETLEIRPEHPHDYLPDDNALRQHMEESQSISDSEDSLSDAELYADSESTPSESGPDDLHKAMLKTG